ncbi:acyl-CoA dehydrogenase family protein [Streptomyces prunicolor]|uniref:acyl-CoA dehydrogenase family protein n=1 Tax=Streptomyces prunicolor TaxID=67348 RepID=UPI00340F8DE7
MGRAEPLVERQLQVAIVLQSAETCGALERVFEFTTQWAFDRYSFGRPLASYQALKHRFADMKTWIEACHATTGAAARAVQDGAEDAAELVSVAKSYVGSRSTQILQDCVQMHGGIGVTWEHDLHLYLRRATVNRALYGTPEDHRLRIADIIAPSERKTS